MKRTIATVLAAAAMAAGCERPSPRDVARVEAFNAAYGARYAFSTREDLYLVARARPGVRVEPAETERLFRAFFLEAEGGRAAETLVYMNVYDARGEFLYQLYYDPATSRIARSRAEAY